MCLHGPGACVCVCVSPQDGEITPSEGSSDDYMSDESGQGEGEEEECEASDMGGDSEGDEGVSDTHTQTDM